MNTDQTTKERLEKSKSLLRKLREERLISKVKESVNPEKELHEMYKTKVKEILFNYTIHLQNTLKKCKKEGAIFDQKIAKKTIHDFVEENCRCE